jgi:hypothetical protein
MGAISRGWALTKQSWAVLRNDRSLVIFPILSTVFAMIAVAVIWVPTVVVAGVFQDGTVNENNPAVGVAAVVTIYVSTFIAIFFNVALAACAVRSLRGEDTRVGEGLSAAMRRIGPIVGWTLVAGTVGLILRVLEERFPIAGKIAVWIAGAAWAIATFFVVPVIALEGTGPTPLAIAVGVVVGAAVIVVAIISSALNSIFRVAVYQYAATGQAPAAFDSRLAQTAFDAGTRRA